MKFRLGERGIIMAEFAIALPLLILLLGSLGLVTLKALKIAREQVADYALETEAQYVMDRVTSDARAAHSVKITSNEGFDKITFICHTNKKNSSTEITFYDIFMQRIYLVHSAEGKSFGVYTKRTDDDKFTSPLTGENFYGKTCITKFSVDREKLKQKILHVTLEMKNIVTQKKIRLSTSVFMPACK